MITVFIFIMVIYSFSRKNFKSHVYNDKPVLCSADLLLSPEQGESPPVVLACGCPPAHVLQHKKYISFP